MTSSSPATSNPSKSWLDTPNLNIAAAGTRFAYRKLGADKGVPLVMLNHWGATLDNFDPRIVDTLAVDRTVYTLDYRGVGGSGGEAPLTIAEMASDIIAVIGALGLETVDLLGFSLGGFVVQDILRQAPALARKIILTGTGPAGGVGIANVGKVSAPLIVKGLLTFKDPKTYLFFTASPGGRKAAQAFLARLKERAQDRDAPIKTRAFQRQLKAIKAWGLQAPQDLGAVLNLALVVNGDNDIMVPSANTIDLAHRLPRSELVLYPDAGHGGIFQYHEVFAPKARAFLDA